MTTHHLPMALFPASSQAEKAYLHQISRQTGHRLRQQMVDETTGTVVKDDKGRDYESPRASMSRSSRRRSKRSGLKARTPSTSRSSCRSTRSTDATSTGPTTSCRMAKRAKKRLP